MDPSELSGVKFSLQHVQGGAHEMLVTANVDVNIIAKGFDPINVISWNEEDPPFGSDGDSRIPSWVLQPVKKPD